MSDLGWNLLHQVKDIENLIDETFIKDFLHYNSPKFKVLLVVKFLDFIVRANNETLNMAIQKHLTVFAQQKPAEQQATSTINDIMQIIDILEKRKVNNSEVLKMLIDIMAQAPLPREAHQLQAVKIDIMRISEFFKNLELNNDERCAILWPIFNHITETNYEPQPLVALGLIVIPDEMINQAIEAFLNFVRVKGKHIRESIVNALNRLIFWQRSYSHLQLDQWISRTLSMLNTYGYGDVIDDIAAKNIISSFLTLVIPIYQGKVFNIVQGLLENAKGTKEIFDKIADRSVTMLKKLEDTKSDIFEPLMELICETLCTIDRTDLKYREIVS